MIKQLNWEQEYNLDRLVVLEVAKDTVFGESLRIDQIVHTGVNLHALQYELDMIEHKLTHARVAIEEHLNNQ